VLLAVKAMDGESAPRLGARLVRTYNDHRVAMSFGLLRLSHDGIDIENGSCVGISFPGFWAELARFKFHHDGER
jgi:3-phosphoshikimate 1-carboxyvinyltransferase